MPYSPEDQVRAPEKLIKYNLMHFSTNVKAPLEMKDVMYRARGKLQALRIPSSQLPLGFDYRDPRIDKLKSILVSKFRFRVLSVLTIREETPNDPYAEPEYRQALKELEAEDRIKVQRVESKRTGLADGDLIHFP